MLQCPFLIVTLENEKYLSEKRQQYEFYKSIDVKTKSTGVQGRIFTENSDFYALKRLNVVDLDLNSIAFKIGT